MKLLAQAVFLVCFAATVAAQEPPPQDCTVGHLQIGGQAPTINKHEYRRGVSDWFFIPTAKHYKSLGWSATFSYDQFIEIENGTLVAIVREFTTDRTHDVVEALRQRYGDPVRPHAKLSDWDGWSSEKAQLTWFDAACGLRIDAFQSVDPGDPDERSVVVWTKGVNASVPVPLDAIR